MSQCAIVCNESWRGAGCCLCLVFPQAACAKGSQPSLGEDIMKMVFRRTFCAVIALVLCGKLLSMKHSTVVLSINKQQLDVATMVTILAAIGNIIVGYGTSKWFIWLHRKRNTYNFLMPMESMFSTLSRMVYEVLIGACLIAIALIIKGMLYGSYDILLVAMPSYAIGYYWGSHLSQLAA